MTKQKKASDNLANFLFEVGSLRKIMRAHSQTLLTNDMSDNIASHSYRVSVIGYFLALREKADVSKVITMCLFHDVAEARSGDQNWVHKKYVKSYEDEISQSQFSGLNDDGGLKKIMEEYVERKTLESRLAKDADLIDQILLLKEYEWQGNKEAAVWLAGEQQYNRLFSKTAKKISKMITVTKPSDWWSSLWTSERR